MINKTREKMKHAKTKQRKPTKLEKQNSQEQEKKKFKKK